MELHRARPQVARIGSAQGHENLPATLSVALCRVPVRAPSLAAARQPVRGVDNAASPAFDWSASAFLDLDGHDPRLLG